MRGALRKLRRVRALAPSERALLLQATCALPAVHLSLRVMRLRSLFAALERWTPPAPTDRAAPDPAVLVWQVRSAVALAAFHGPTRGTCLSRSTTMWWLLRRHGVRADLRIGVRKHRDDLMAHAWVECAGEAINDHEGRVREYAPFRETLLS